MSVLIKKLLIITRSCQISITINNHYVILVSHHSISGSMLLFTFEKLSILYIHFFASNKNEIGCFVSIEFNRI